MTLVLAIWASGSAARAGIYTDDLAKCLVKSTSASDQKALVVWIFSAMSWHPAIQSYSSMTDGQKDAASRVTAGLMERLLIADCRKETVAAVKYEGGNALQGAFGVLGQVAMRDLMTDPKVNASMAKVGEYMDETKLEDLGKEAGISSASGATPR
jgi:hypothetical protein